MRWKQLLASITRSVDEELRLRNAYLAENCILRHHIKGRVPLTDAERKTLAEMGQKLGKKALDEVATIAQPDTILAWHRTLMPQTCDHSPPRKSVGRPRMDQELEALVVRMARENRSWGYDRMVGAVANLGYRISDQTVGNIRERLVLGGHAATCWGAARNPGYHSRKVASQSPFNTRVRIWSRRCAPRGVQAICCFLQKRLLIT